MLLSVIRDLFIKIPSFLSIQEVFSANLLLSRSKYVLLFFLDIVFTPSPFKSITIGEVLVEAGSVSGKVSFGESGSLGASSFGSSSLSSSFIVKSISFVTSTFNVVPFIPYELSMDGLIIIPVLSPSTLSLPVQEYLKSLSVLVDEVNS